MRNTLVVMIVALTACNKLTQQLDTPGGIPRPPGSPTAIDPSGCKGFPGPGDAGRKLRLFLQATRDLEKATVDTVDVVKGSCVAMGNELGMTDADYRGDTKDICATVYGRVRDGLAVAFKAQGAVKFHVTPPVCRVDARAQAQAAAQCEGSAKVEASAQCRASASVKASLDVQCTEPSVDVQVDAKLVVDTKQAERTIKALKAGLPKILAVRSRLVPLGDAVKDWVASVRELESAGLAFANQFKDQALCASGQIAAAVSAIGRIEGNLSVSVSVSASASGTIGGGL